jgi:hypothetical protein
MDYGWKVSARQYLKTRQELAGLDAAAFQAYYLRWWQKSLMGMLDKDLAKAAKWLGFNDALNDEALLRQRGPEGGDEDLKRLLDYLYEEAE